MFPLCYIEINFFLAEFHTIIIYVDNYYSSKDFPISLTMGLKMDNLQVIFQVGSFNFLLLNMLGLTAFMTKISKVLAKILRFVENCHCILVFFSHFLKNYNDYKIPFEMFLTLIWS